MASLDLTGQRFGKLVAVERLERVRDGWLWRCRCDCGTERDIVAAVLRRRGGSRSCGCARLEAVRTHGLTGTSLHSRWRTLRARCRNPNSQRYADYGGRGISCDPQWDDFRAFAEWAHANGFREELQLDRIDNDGDYTPGNCRWVTPHENMMNRQRRSPSAGDTIWSPLDPSLCAPQKSN
jgi:hypothetical protein